MRRRSAIPSVVFVLVALTVRGMAGEPDPASPRAASPAVDDRAAAATSTPQVLVSGPPDWEPLPEGCTPERVVGIVLGFVDAFNRGDGERLAALFTPDLRDADGTPTTLNQAEPGWFAVKAVGDEPWVDATSDAEMLAWVEARRARGERWTLLQLAMGGYWWKGGVNIGFDVRREADDLPARVVGGKGSVICNSSRDGTIYRWNVGPDEVLPDRLFEPGATPHAHPTREATSPPSP